MNDVIFSCMKYWVVNMNLMQGSCLYSFFLFSYEVFFFRRSQIRAYLKDKNGFCF